MFAMHRNILNALLCPERVGHILMDKESKMVHVDLQLSITKTASNLLFSFLKLPSDKTFLHIGKRKKKFHVFKL